MCTEIQVERRTNNSFVCSFAVLARYFSSFSSTKKGLSYFHDLEMSSDTFEVWEFCECCSSERSDMEVPLLYESPFCETPFSFSSEAVATISISPGSAHVLTLSRPLSLLLLPLVRRLLRRLWDLRLLVLPRLRVLLRLPLFLRLRARSRFSRRRRSRWARWRRRFASRRFLTPNLHGWLGHGSITPSPVPSPNDSCPR